MHPSREELHGLLLGTLSEERADSIARHIDACLECEDTVANLEDATDPFVRLLREPPDPDDLAADSGCQRFLARVEALGRETDAPATDLGELGQYKLLAKLGEGGMGAVYKALHTRLDKVVAIKVLPAARMRDAHAVERFEREMKAVGRLDHPHIVRAMDAGEHEGTHYLVMEYVDGLDLSQLARQIGPLPIAEACELIRQAALGLEEAHRFGMVHRDIKPSNLMLTGGGFRIADFGLRIEEDNPQSAIPNPKSSQSAIIKVLDLGLALFSDAHAVDARGLTGTGQIMGTLDYMAPEQGGDAHVVDIRADIYSLGATLYRLLAGRSIYHGEQYQTAVQKVTALATQPAPPIQSQRPDVPAALAAVVHRMLEKNPADRYNTPSEVAAALAPFTAEANPAALLARANVEPAQPAQKISFASTTSWRESASAQETPVPTSPPRPLAPSRARAGEGARGRGGEGEKWLLALTSRVGRRPVAVAAGMAAVLLLGAVFTFRTPQGTVEIELADGVEAADVEVRVKRSGEVVEVADARQGWTVKLQDGAYELELQGASDKFQLSKQTIHVTRGNKELVRIALVPDKPGAATEALAEHPSTPIGDRRTITPEDGWVDLLPAIDPVRYAAKGTWSKTERGLELLEGDHPPIIAAGVVAGGDCRVRVRFSTINGFAHVGVPVNDRYAGFSLNGRDSGVIGFSSIMGQSSRPFTVEPEKQYVAEFEVRSDGEQATLLLSVNGKKAIDWTGPLDALQRMRERPLPGLNSIVLASPQGTTFQEVSLRMLSGEAQVLPPAEVPAAIEAAKTKALARDVFRSRAELLPLVDPTQDALAGDWRRDSAGLSVEAQGTPARLQLPVAPRGDYTLEAHLVRAAHGKEHALGLVLPVGERSVLVALDTPQRLGGLSRIGGRDLAQGNGTGKERAPLEDGRRHVLTASVRKQEQNADAVEIAVDLDGERLLRWRGLPESLSLSPDDELRDAGAIGLVAADCDLRFEKIRLTMRDGYADLLRPHLYEVMAMHNAALVTHPAPLPGMLYWTIEPREEAPLVRDLAVSPDNDHLAVTRDDGTTWIFDTTSDELVRRVHAPGQRVMWSPDGRRLALTYQWLALTYQYRAYIWDTESWEQLTTIKHQGQHPEGEIGWSPDNKTLAIGNGGKGDISKAILLVDVATGKTRELYSSEYSIMSIDWSATGKLAALMRTSDGAFFIRILDPESGEVVREIRSGGSGPGVAVSPDGSRVANGRSIWSLETGERVAQSGYVACYAVAWSPDGATVARAGSIWSDRSVVIFAKSDSGSTVGRAGYVNRREGFRCVTWLDNDHVAAGVDASRWNAVIRIYRRDGEQRAALQLLRDRQFAIVSPDGHWRGSERAEEHLHYVLLTDEGQRETLTPAEFAARFAWQNDPTRARLLPESP